MSSYLYLYLCLVFSSNLKSQKSTLSMPPPPLIDLLLHLDWEVVTKVFCKFLLFVLPDYEQLRADWRDVISLFLRQVASPPRSPPPPCSDWRGVPAIPPSLCHQPPLFVRSRLWGSSSEEALAASIMPSSAPITASLSSMITASLSSSTPSIASGSLRRCHVSRGGGSLGGRNVEQVGWDQCGFSAASFERSHRKSSHGITAAVAFLLCHPRWSIVLESVGRGVRCFGGFLRVLQLGALMADESRGPDPEIAGWR